MAKRNRMLEAGLYVSTDDEQIIDLLEKAHRTNIKRDKIDNATGFASPGDMSADSQLRTAICAILSGVATGLRGEGLSGQSLSCIAEGVAMVQEVELILRKWREGMKLRTRERKQ